MADRPSRGRQPSGYDGRLQAVADGVAVGWACDLANPERRVEVTIEAEGEVMAEAVADIARDELVQEGIGDGAHGFEIALPEALQSQAYVRVVALVGPERLRLPRSDSFWQTARSGSVWSSVRFVYGRQGDPETDAEMPVDVPPPPSSPPPRVLVGRDGWLFDAAELDSGGHPSALALSRLVDELGSIAAACAEIGVPYILACVPDKLDAVAEGSPLTSEPQRLWLTELRACLRDLDGLEILDLLPVLDDAKRHGHCFHRSDSDWNDRGAFFAARALIKEAGKRVPALKPPPLADLHLRPCPGYRGVLADAPMTRLEGHPSIGWDSGAVCEDGIVIDPARLRAERMPVERHLAGADVHVRLLAREDAGLSPRLSVVGDGVCLPLLPWLAETAARTTFFWTATPPMEPVELELPDAVLHLLRYRDLARLAAGQPDGL
jgi:hypothetical protein